MVNKRNGQYLTVNELENIQLLIKSLLVFDSFELCLSLIDLAFSIKIYRQIKVNSVES